ncbi:hypothetical protein LTR37_013380 [Vermiconidia calcicola]|uniref:Uncharacterized protein n=1 Tax=Vermiconidia calcicola TaxID=1690605 RepID=A0ACC3MY15_9PEZI|nr:hypothetical protein LTR37_013380 [Vermiconidia calcicola]
MILPDGRTLCFAQYGTPSGFPVLYLHGGGDARKGGAFFNEPGRRLGARIIACDRPGIGGSSPQPDRTVLDHARDIQCLADHLDISEFCVIGVSGGGPYALACASSIPAERLKGVAIVCGMGPPSINSAHIGWPTWLMLKVYEYCPIIFRWYIERMYTTMQKHSDEDLREMYQQQARPGRFSWLNMNEKDAQLFQDDGVLALSIKGNREYCRQGLHTCMEEWRVWIADPAFKIEDIRSDLPVHLWYGKLDSGVPPRMGEHIAACLGGRAVLHVENEGHLSLVVNWREPILETLLP